MRHARLHGCTSESSEPGTGCGSPPGCVEALTLPTAMTHTATLDTLTLAVVLTLLSGRTDAHCHWHARSPGVPHSLDSPLRVLTGRIDWFL